MDYGYVHTMVFDASKTDSNPRPNHLNQMRNVEKKVTFQIPCQTAEGRISHIKIGLICVKNAVKSATTFKKSVEGAEF